MKTTSITAPHCHYEQNSRRHKCSSEKSISKAAQCFRNVYEYKPSTLICVQTQYSYMCTNPVLFASSLPILERSLLICGTAVPQANVWKDVPNVSVIHMP